MQLFAPIVIVAIAGGSAIAVSPLDMIDLTPPTPIWADGSEIAETAAAPINLSELSAMDLSDLSPPVFISADEAPSSQLAAGTPASQPVAVGSSSKLGGAVDLAELSTIRGGDGHTAVISDQTLTAINSGNSLNAQTIGSGDISLGAGAFSGFAGLGNFAINSGHNNNLQASVSISINVTPSVGP